MALTASQTIEGPRLDDLKVTSADYGVPLENVWGTVLVDGRMVWAEDLREVKRRRKTKGGKYNEYTYYGSWGLALAAHEITNLRRVWFDGHIVLDLTGAGPITPFDFGENFEAVQEPVGTDGISYAQGHFAFYPGSETQTADPRMKAHVEAEFGVGYCPAYRGTPLLLCKEIPLEKLGNRIPQVKIEIAVGEANPYAITPSSVYGLTGWRQHSLDYSLYLLNSGSAHKVIDTATRQIIASGSGVGFTAQMRNGGTIYSIAGNELREYNLEATAYTTVATYVGSVGGITGYCADGAGNEHILVGPGFVNGDFWYDHTKYSLSDLNGKTGYLTGIFRDLDGNVWGIGINGSGTTTEIDFVRLTTIASSPYPATFTVTGLSSLSAANETGEAIHYRDDDVDNFVFHWGGTLYACDPNDASINASATITSGTNADMQMRSAPVGSATAFIGRDEFNLSDLSIKRTIDLSDWGIGYSAASAGLYDPINHAIIVGNSGTPGQAWLFLDRVGQDGVLLSAICADVAGLCGIEDYDFTALDQSVKGWRATRGEGRNMVEPLLDIHDSILRPHGFSIQGIKRSGVSTGTLTVADDFVKAQPRYAASIKRGNELPRVTFLDFSDVNADFQRGSIPASRPGDVTDAEGIERLDMVTMTASADEAQGLISRYHRRKWAERRHFSFALTAQQYGLEPGDVKTLILDGVSEVARLKRMTVKANGQVGTEWVADRPSLATLDGIGSAEQDGFIPETVTIPMIAQGFVMDVPYVRETDDQLSPVLYVAASPYVDGPWAGATVLEGIPGSGDYVDELAAISSTDEATWGAATNALADRNPWLLDEGAGVNIDLKNGTLAGATLAELHANPSLNLAAIGQPGAWEFIQFTTATLEGDGTYTLTGLRRGRRGTNGNTGGHAAGDRFVLLDEAAAVPVALSEVGTAQSFKVVSLGRSSTTAPEINLTFSGASLKPWSPVHLKGTKDSGSGDWDLEWVRRTRIGGQWRSGQSIPLSEDSEEYEVEIMNGSTVVRTITGLTSPAYTYSAADQTTDFGSGQSALTFRVYQISSKVGRGFVATATV